jgi:hypothetical protein
VADLQHLSSGRSSPVRGKAPLVSAGNIPDSDVYRDLLVKVYTAFEMMPCLHGAIRTNIREVRGEVNRALDTFMPELIALMPDLVSDAAPWPPLWAPDIGERS